MPHHYDPNQPRIARGHEGGGRWTDGHTELIGSNVNSRSTPDPGTESVPLSLIEQVALPVENPTTQREGDFTLAFSRPPGPPRHPAVQLVLAFAALLSRPWQNRTGEVDPANDINAHDFRLDPNGRPLMQRITRKEVKDVCTRFDWFQEMATEIDRDVRREMPHLSPAQHGTEVHTRLAHKIRELGDPNFRAEVSKVKSEEADAIYGENGSKRMDGLQTVNNKTLCVLDLKTGKKGLPFTQAFHYAEVLLKHPNMRIIVSEVRPYE